MYVLRFTGFAHTAAWFLAITFVSVLTYIAVVARHLYLHVASEATVAVGHGQRPSSQPALAQKVGQNGSTLELRWSPVSGRIQNATVGILNINDGPITRQIVLDQAQLRSGRIVYAPVSGDATFDLKVTDSTSHNIAESIRALASSSGAASIGSLLKHRGAVSSLDSSNSPDSSRRSSQPIAASPLDGISKKQLPIGRARSGNRVSAARKRSVSKLRERKSGGQVLKHKSSQEPED
jgi:hypothetical protein